MTSTLTTPAQSAGLFLFGTDPARALADRLTETKALHETRDRLLAAGGSVPAGTAATIGELSTDFLSQDISTVAIAGWRKHRELLDAADRTRGTRATAIVSLSTHQISWRQQPTIDVLLGPATVAVIRFELCIDVEVVSVAAVVRGGYLVGLEGGRCDVTASFSAAGVLVAERTVTLDPHLALDLGAGVALGGSGEHVAGPAG